MTDGDGRLCWDGGGLGAGGWVLGLWWFMFCVAEGMVWRGFGGSDVAAGLAGIEGKSWEMATPTSSDA